MGHDLIKGLTCGYFLATKDLWGQAYDLLLGFRVVSQRITWLAIGSQVCGQNEYMLTMSYPGG